MCDIVKLICCAVVRLQRSAQPSPVDTLFNRTNNSKLDGTSSHHNTLGFIFPLQHTYA